VTWFFTTLGPLRGLLVATTLLVTLTAPFADGQVHVHDWRLWPSVIAPTLVMMLAFAIPLDICMAKVFMSDCEPATQARLRNAIRIQILALVTLLLAWTPFMLKVLDFWPFD